jgi:hypothetical protein
MKNNRMARYEVLLRAAYDLLKTAEDSHIVLETHHILTHYDGADCDGSCLMTDIQNALDLDEGQEPIALDEPSKQAS